MLDGNEVDEGGGELLSDCISEGYQVYDLAKVAFYFVGGSLADAGEEEGVEKQGLGSLMLLHFTGLCPHLNTSLMK